MGTREMRVRDVNEYVNVIGFLFSLAIAFWSGQMAIYVSKGPAPVLVSVDKVNNLGKKLAATKGDSDNTVPISVWLGAFS